MAARDELRKAFIQKDYAKVLAISESIRQEYPTYSADSFYETAAQMRLGEKARAAEGNRPYPKLEDLPTEQRDLSTAPSLGLTPDWERLIERNAQNLDQAPNGQPVPIEVAANTQTDIESETPGAFDDSPIPAITPIPALTPNIDNIAQATSPGVSQGDQGGIPPGLVASGAQNPQTSPASETNGAPGEQLVATASTPVPINSSLGASPAEVSGTGPLNILGFTLPPQIGYILLGIIIAVIIVVVLLQFLGRRREDRVLEEALATHGGTLSGTHGGALIDDDEDIVQGYPPELDEHGGSTQIDAFDDDFSPVRREAIQPSSTAVEEPPALGAMPLSGDSGLTDDDFDALFASDEEDVPGEDTGMETGVMDMPRNEDLPATDFGALDILELDFRDAAVSEADETFSFDSDPAPELEEPEVMLDSEVHVGSPSIWSELDAAGTNADNDVISFDDPDSDDAISDNSDVDMSSATHSSFEERAMDSTRGMSDSEIQGHLDEDLPSTDMKMREFHQDETVDVRIAEAADSGASEELVFDEPELSPTKDADLVSLDFSDETQASSPQLDDPLIEPEHAATSDATSFANMELDSAAPENSDLGLDSPEIADTQGIENLHGMETLVVDPPDFGQSPEPAPAPREPKQSAVQDLIQNNSKQQTPMDKSPIVNAGDSLFDRELRQGEEAFEGGDWTRAVHHLSIAAALKPDNKPIREKLRDARSKRNQQD